MSVWLTEEQRAIRDAVKQFAQRHIKPHALQWEAQHSTPQSTIQAMAEMGLLSMLMPIEYHGAAVDMISYVLAIEEIAAADGGCSTLMSVNNSVVCQPIYTFGNAQQREYWLPKLASAQALGCFCLTEPDAGSDASQLKTSAARHQNGYLLNGTKQFITSASEATIAIVFAVTDPLIGKKGISAFLVPTNSDGYEVTHLEDKMGQKASSTGQIVFDNVFVDDAQVLGTIGEGYKIALASLGGGRLGIAAQCIGMARAAYEIALSYAQTRQTFGRPIIEHQAVGFRLADMAMQIELARNLLLTAAQMKQQHIPCRTEAAMAKLYASEMAERVVSAAMQTLGGYGYLSDYLIEKIYRDVRVAQIYEGTSDILRMVIQSGLRG